MKYLFFALAGIHFNLVWCCENTADSYCFYVKLFSIS